MKKCKYCDIEFEPKNPKGKFCSDKCRVYFGRRKSKLGFKFGDTVLHGFAAVKPDGTKSVLELEKPITLIKVPKNLTELKELCPKELLGLDRSEWIRTERVKYNI